MIQIVFCGVRQVTVGLDPRSQLRPWLVCEGLWLLLLGRLDEEGVAAGRSWEREAALGRWGALQRCAKEQGAAGEALLGVLRVIARAWACSDETSVEQLIVELDVLDAKFGLRASASAGAAGGVELHSAPGVQQGPSGVGTRADRELAAACVTLCGAAFPLSEEALDAFFASLPGYVVDGAGSGPGGCGAALSAFAQLHPDTMQHWAAHCARWQERRARLQKQASMAAQRAAAAAAAAAAASALLQAPSAPSPSSSSPLLLASSECQPTPFRGAPNVDAVSQPLRVASTAVVPPATPAGVDLAALPALAGCTPTPGPHGTGKLPPTLHRSCSRPGQSADAGRAHFAEVGATLAASILNGDGGVAGSGGGGGGGGDVDQSQGHEAGNELPSAFQLSLTELLPQSEGCAGKQPLQQSCGGSECGGEELVEGSGEALEAAAMRALAWCEQMERCDAGDAGDDDGEQREDVQEEEGSGSVGREASSGLISVVAGCGGGGSSSVLLTAGLEDIDIRIDAVSSSDASSLVDMDVTGMLLLPADVGVLKRCKQGVLLTPLEGSAAARTITTAVVQVSGDAVRTPDQSCGGACPAIACGGGGVHGVFASHCVSQAGMHTTTAVTATAEKSSNKVNSSTPGRVLGLLGCCAQVVKHVACSLAVPVLLAAGAAASVVGCRRQHHRRRRRRCCALSARKASEGCGSTATRQFPRLVPGG
jgi:hypothetical protein